MEMPNPLSRSGIVSLLISGCLIAPLAHAVPSFARQTGMACEACHTVFPELTHFGRMFKANGYTIDNLKQVQGITATKEQMLSLSALPPIAVMVQISDTWLKTPLPDSTGAAGHSQTSTVGFPQQISFFYAGKIAPELGAMIQLTYDNAGGSIGIDNTDLRYAHTIPMDDERSLIYGLTVNNNPTVQDLWNSTPAWGFPYASSNANVGSIAGTEIDGTLAQDVAGISAYAMWDESLYGELGAYRSAKQGVVNPTTQVAGPLDGSVSNVISGVAPYFRVAYEYQWGRQDLEIGVYGATFKLYPGGGTAVAPALLNGPANEFRDVAEDFQYQYIGDEQLFSLTGTRIHEAMSLDASFGAQASTNPSDDLTTTRITATYYYHRKYGASLGHFATSGSTDVLLYPANAVVGSANGSPNTNGWMAEFHYMPWLNTKVSLQYTAYDRFNGSSSNYDGAGRSASANNTLYMVLWFNF